MTSRHPIDRDTPIEAVRYLVGHISYDLRYVPLYKLRVA